MKRIIICVITLTVALSIPVNAVTPIPDYGFSVTAELQKYGVLQEISYEPYITRAESVVLISKILGVTDARAYWHSFTESFSGPYTDVDRTRSDFGYINYSMTCFTVGYLDTECPYYSPEWPVYCFKPDENITVNQAIAFIERCISGKGNGLEGSLQIALEIGLIQKDDSFYSETDEWILRNDFYVLLNRMLDYKCNLYDDNDKSITEKEENREKTYRELLAKMMRIENFWPTDKKE